MKDNVQNITVYDNRAQISEGSLEIMLSLMWLELLFFLNETLRVMKGGGGVTLCLMIK